MMKSDTIRTNVGESSTAKQLTRFGVLVLATDASIEADMCAMMPGHCVAHFNRMQNYETCALRKTDHRTDLANAALLLAECENISAVMYGCTSGELLHGRELIVEVLQRIMPNAAVVTPLAASIEAMRTRRIDTVSILSPYSDDLNRRIIELFGQRGITVDTVLSPQSWGHMSLSTIDARELKTAAGSMEFQHSQGLFIPCNALAIVGAIRDLEGCTSVPVFTSTQASVWKALKHENLLGERSLPRFGSIFSNLEITRL